MRKSAQRLRIHGPHHNDKISGTSRGATGKEGNQNGSSHERVGAQIADPMQKSQRGQ